MLDAPLISVVTAAREAEATLSRALESLRDQTIGDWEAIVIDDGSTDGTGEVAASYARLTPRFRVIRGDGAGVSRARNLGLELARGRWVHFLDADDWLDPSFFARMVAALREDTNANVAYGGHRRVLRCGAWGERYFAAEFEADPVLTLRQHCPVAIHAVLAERDAIAAIGGFDETLSTCEDWDLWLRLALADARWISVPSATVYCGVRADSLSSDHRQVLADGNRVITRGFALSRGSDADDDDAPAAPAIARAQLALWTAACAVGKGQPAMLPSDAAETLRGDVRASHHVSHAFLLHGVMTGAAVTETELRRLEPSVMAAAASLLDEAQPTSDEPSWTRRLDYHRDRVFLSPQAKGGIRHGKRSARVEVDLGQPPTFSPRPDVDCVYGRASDVRGHPEFVVGALGDLDSADFYRAALCQMSLTSCGLAALRARPVAVGWKLAAATLKAAISNPGAMRSASSRRALARAAVRRALIGHERAPSGHRHQLDVLRRRAEERARGHALRRPRSDGRAAKEPFPVADRVAFWEAHFRTEDPWDYGNGYEQEKYAHQLDLIPEGRIERALEIGCAEGHFTTQLQARVETLTAVDISPTAIRRARRRLGPSSRVALRQLDLTRDPLPSNQSLTVCSELLYYLDDQVELERVCRRLRDTLAPEGVLITAHAFVLRDDRDRTGFDWDVPFGAAGICAALDQTPDLHLEAAVETELYRIARYRRSARLTAAPQPIERIVPVSRPLPIEVEKRAIPGGATTLRQDVLRHECRTRVTVLMYHGFDASGPSTLGRYRVSPDRFMQQMDWLRRNGFHTITSTRLSHAMRDKRPIEGRPIVITVDDGLESFATRAWPIMRERDLYPEVFLPTAHIGGTAEWDGDDGRTLPLMAPATLARLASEGVGFGSHFHHHVRADGLSSHAIAEELLVSRALIEAWTGLVPNALALPFSVADARIPHLAADCGYEVIYGSRVGRAQLGESPFDIPRIEVRGQTSLAAFIRAVQGPW